jgi:hypothetical protein
MVTIALITAACLRNPAPVQSSGLLIAAEKQGPVGFTHIGYNSGTQPDNRYEHVHLCDSSGKRTDISGWRLYSPVTGDSFVFPTGARAGDCTPNTETTVNTHVGGNEDNQRIYSWRKPIGKDEWPDNGGVAHLYNASDQLVGVCTYTTSWFDGGNAECK